MRISDLSVQVGLINDLVEYLLMRVLLIFEMCIRRSLVGLNNYIGCLVTLISVHFR